MKTGSEPIYVVTGASAGMGCAVAMRLASRQFKVVAAARSDDRLKTLEKKFPDVVTTVAVDLADSTGIGKLVDAVGDNQTIAGIVHAAGSLVELESYSDLDSEELVNHFNIHVAAPISLTKRLAAGNSIERMLFIDSYSASSARDGWAAYSIVKAAAQMSARCAAQELKDSIIIRVFPGAVRTQIVDVVLKSDTATAKTFGEMLTRGECIEPETAAEFIVGLLVDASDELLTTRDAWDYNRTEDRRAVFGQ